MGSFTWNFKRKVSEEATLKEVWSLSHQDGISLKASLYMESAECTFFRHFVSSRISPKGLPNPFSPSCSGKQYFPAPSIYMITARLS